VYHVCLCVRNFAANYLGNYKRFEGFVSNMEPKGKGLWPVD